MRAVQAIGFIGRMMIRAGVLLLLFVAFQLWGTGVQTSRAQDALSNEFEEQRRELGLDGTTTPPPNGTSSSTAPATPATTATTTPATPPLPPPAEGEPVGRIMIPDIGVDFIIVEGVALKWLEDGPGHFPETPLPGQPGNSAVAGHRVTYLAPFHRLDELAPGARITIETLQGTFEYEVLPQPGPEGEPPIGHYIINPYQREILDDKGDNRITLMACHPKYSAAKRIVVEARLLTPPAPPTPRPPVPPDEPDELIGGEPTALGPAIAFSAAALGLWFATWLVGHRYRKFKWPAYLVALPFFSVLLFMAFMNINRYLPAGY